MAFNDSLSSTFTAVVRSVNERGVRLEGHESWLNFSKYAVGLVAPERGQTVTVVTDKAGFVRAVTVLDGPAPIAGGSDAVRPAQSRSAASVERDRTITRLAVLRSAVQLAQGRSDLSSADVLKVAETFEAWVYREANEDD